MEAESRYTFVGAAVIALVVALVASMLWLKNIGGRDWAHYAIEFEEQALDGLDVGASVSLRGIQVGRVEDYALIGSSGNAVRVKIRVDRRVPVRQDTVAVVTRNLVTGIATIALVNREKEGALLAGAATATDTLPLIAEGRSDLDEIAGRVNAVGEVATKALSNLAELLNPENQETLMGAVAGVRDLSAGLAQRLDGMEVAVQQISAAARQAGNAAESASTAARELGSASQRIAGVVEQSGSKLGTALVQSEQTLLQAQQALDQVTRAVADVQRQAVLTAQRLEGTAAGVDDQLRGAVAELRLSTEVAARALDGLRDPRASLLGPSKAQLGPGEVLP